MLSNPAWRPRLCTPYLIRRVTAAPQTVGRSRSLDVGGTVIVAADPVAFVTGLHDGYQRLEQLHVGP
jgi:hypothetical protein